MDNILREVVLNNGEHLILRQPIEEDAKAMIDYLKKVGGESDNLLFGKDEFSFTVEQEMEFIKRINNDQNTLMAIGIINDSVVSIAQIGCHQKKRISHNSEIAISVKKQYWRSGIGSAIMEELIRFANNHSLIKNIGLGVKASNDNAIKLYEKFEFVKVGYHKDYFNVDGKYDDLILMDLSLDK
jgi:RimJ/RimL family protein N-acetyltransferase